MHKKVSDVPYAFVRSYHKDGFTDQVMVVLFQCAWGWDSEVLSNDDGITNTGQKDNYPPQGNGTGDARDCEGNFDCGTDRDV